VDSLHDMERAHELDFSRYLRIAFSGRGFADRLCGFIKKHGAEISRLYLLVGEIERAGLAVASMCASRIEQYAVPEFGGESA
jgi:hypothetical protein